MQSIATQPRTPQQHSHTARLNHAVLYQDARGYYNVLKADETPCKSVTLPSNLELLLPLFEKHRVDVLWIFPGSPLSQSIERAHFDALDKDRCKIFPATSEEIRKKKPAFIAVQRKGTANKYEPNRYFAFPEHAEWSSNGGAWELTSPWSLLETVRYLEQEFEMGVLWGPGHMAMNVLKRTHEQRHWTIENLQNQASLRPVFNQVTLRPSWSIYERIGGTRHGLTAAQRACKYLHGYDKNGQYLGAAQSVMLPGNGAFEFVDDGADAFTSKTIGFWHYQIRDVANTPFNGYSLPCPLSMSRSWASTSLIEAARAVGVDLDILEGVMWREGRKYLEPWAKEMWGHRAHLKSDTEMYPHDLARENAVGTAKLAANSLMGRLAKPKISEYSRPDWNWMVVHQAIANQFYSLNKMQRDYGVKPVLVTTDAFWIVSDEPDPGLAIPGILDYAQEQRGFKHLGTVPMSDEIITRFKTQQPEDISTYLKNLTNEGE